MASQPDSSCALEHYLGGAHRILETITPPTSAFVLETLELGTAEYEPAVCRETQRIAFLNYVLKPVFRSDPRERVFGTHQPASGVRRVRWKVSNSVSVCS